jgi:hypothetical protein
MVITHQPSEHSEPVGCRDACIMAGIEIIKANGSDPDLNARNLGSSLCKLLRHHPGLSVDGLIQEVHGDY